MARRRTTDETTQMRMATRPEATALLDTITVGLQGATNRHREASQEDMVVHPMAILPVVGHLQVADRLQTMVGRLPVDTTHVAHHQTHVVHRQAQLHMVRHHLHMARHHRSMALRRRLCQHILQAALHLATERHRLATARRLPVMEPHRRPMVRHLQVMGLHRQAMVRRLAMVPLLLATARHLLVMVLLVLQALRLQAMDRHLGMGLLPAMAPPLPATGHHQVLEALPQVMNLGATLAE